MDINSKGESFMGNCEHEGHSECCRYNDDDMLLYAYMQLTDTFMALVSANEVALFDDLLEAANNSDKNLTVDMDTCDSLPYKIIYGAVMCRDDFTIEDLKRNLKDNLGCAFIHLDDFDGQTVMASAFYDFVISEEFSVSDHYLPFVALAKTNIELHNSDASYTLFPYLGGLVWESMVNKRFLVACRETLEIDGLTEENWKEHISWDDMEKYYSVADKYTGEDIDEE